MTENEKFIVHKQWGLDWYICKKCHNWPPYHKPYCGKCAEKYIWAVVLILSAIVAWVTL